MTNLQLLCNSRFAVKHVLFSSGLQNFSTQSRSCSASTIIRNPVQLSSRIQQLVRGCVPREHFVNSNSSFAKSPKMDTVTHKTTTDSSTTETTFRRNALVTGVARRYGIGWRIVREFVGQGYRVLGADIQDLDFADQANLDGLSRDDFHFVKADISDPLQAKHIVERGVQWFGPRINVLINNAGRTNLGDNAIESCTVTIAVNLNGAYYMSLSALPYMPPGTSSIIHMSSTRALQSEPNTEAYSASKAGLLGLTHAQAITLAGKVRVNAVLPGWINTDPSGDALRPEDHAWHPVGRVGVPKDVADLCLFLCDDGRAGFITGQEFVIDGGTTKKMVYPEE